MFISLGGSKVSATDIFISYSREDRSHAKNVAACLEREGFNVWWDAALHSGESFDMVIERQLNEAKAVVVLWSPRSVKSRWVRAEATMADKRGKLAPVIIEDCERPIIFELMHTVDLTHWTGDGGDPVWSQFLHDLRRITHTQKLEAAPVAAPEPSVAESEDESFEATQFYTSASAPNLIAHRLDMLANGEVERSFDVGPLGLRIGRGEASDVQLTDKNVSRRHCVVEPVGDDLVVTDLGSTNGTFIDGDRVEDKAALPPGSVLRVGTTEFVHQLPLPDGDVPAEFDRR